MHSGKKTKIIATIGPATESEEMIKDLIQEGVNVFRFNTKHNTNEWHSSHIKTVKKVSAALSISVGILVDLQGPEIRLDTKDGIPIELSSGENIELVGDFRNATNPKCILVPDLVIKTLQSGDKFSIDDGFIDFEVTSVQPNSVTARVDESSVIQTRKGLNLVGKDIALPSLTPADIDRLQMIREAEADFVALSFVRSKQDVETLKSEMAKLNLDCRIVSKIESRKGVDNIDEIIDVSDGIMIARGDLGIEIPIEQVTHIQKVLIKKCRDKSKPVIVATQMLQSMIESPRPTRAEAADVANAVYDETDGVMLSGETAAGKYPLKAVAMMKKILKYNEGEKHQDAFEPKSHDQTHLIAGAAISIINDRHKVKIDRIIVFTETGHTARIIASYRPSVPVIAISDDRRTVGALTLSYGMAPFYAQFEAGEYSYPERIINSLLSVNVLQRNSTILIVHGKRWKEPGGTNALVVVNL